MFFLIIIGVVGYMTVGVNLFEKMSNQKVRLEMMNIQKAIHANVILGEKTPKDLDTFIVNNMGAQVGEAKNEDPWGIPYFYNRMGDDYEIASAGEDMKIGTPDDVVLVSINHQSKVTFGAYTKADSIARPKKPTISKDPLAALVAELYKSENLNPDFGNDDEFTNWIKKALKPKLK